MTAPILCMMIISNCPTLVPFSMSKWHYQAIIWEHIRTISWDHSYYLDSSDYDLFIGMRNQRQYIWDAVCCPYCATYIVIFVVWNRNNDGQQVGIIAITRSKMETSYPWRIRWPEFLVWAREFVHLAVWGAAQTIGGLRMAQWCSGILQQLLIDPVFIVFILSVLAASRRETVLQWKKHTTGITIIYGLMRW